MAQSIVFSSVAISSTSASADTINDVDLKSQITNIVFIFMDARMSRAEGTFYIRDATPDSTDEPFYRQLS